MPRTRRDGRICQALDKKSLVANIIINDPSHVNMKQVVLFKTWWPVTRLFVPLPYTCRCRYRLYCNSRSKLSVCSHTGPSQSYQSFTQTADQHSTVEDHVHGRPRMHHVTEGIEADAQSAWMNADLRISLSHRIHRYTPLRHCNEEELVWSTRKAHLS